MATRSLAPFLALLALLQNACGDDSSAGDATDTVGPPDGQVEADADGEVAPDGVDEADTEDDGIPDVPSDATDEGFPDVPPDTTDEGDAPVEDATDPLTACRAALGDWDPAWAALEEQVVTVLNDRRALGADCRTAGVFAAAGAVTMEPHLQCAARIHSAYMATTEHFGYESPGGVLGETLHETVGRAGYSGVVVAQEIGIGSASAESLIDLMLSADADCANLMQPLATQIGVGHSGAGTGMFAHSWTLVLGY